MPFPLPKGSNVCVLVSFWLLTSVMHWLRVALIFFSLVSLYHFFMRVCVCVNFLHAFESMHRLYGFLLSVRSSLL